MDGIGGRLHRKFDLLDFRHGIFFQFDYFLFIVPLYLCHVLTMLLYQIFHFLFMLPSNRILFLFDGGGEGCCLCLVFRLNLCHLLLAVFFHVLHLILMVQQFFCIRSLVFFFDHGNRRIFLVDCGGVVGGVVVHVHLFDLLRMLCL